MAAETTKERILDAAERLFGTYGFEGTSLRALTSAAEVNLAAVHYHFGSKDDLLRAAVSRRTDPLNRERLRRLEAIEAAHPDGVLPLEPLLEALVEPVLRMGGSAQEREHVRRIAARIFAEPPEIVGPLLAEVFGEVARRFLEALSRALPELSREEVALRLHFAIGVLIHAISDHHYEVLIPGVPEIPRDESALVERMVAFLSAGFHAPCEHTTRAAPRGERGHR